MTSSVFNQTIQQNIYFCYKLSWKLLSSVYVQCKSMTLWSPDSRVQVAHWNESSFDFRKIVSFSVEVGKILTWSNPGIILAHLTTDSNNEIASFLEMNRRLFCRYCINQRWHGLGQGRSRQSSWKGKFLASKDVGKTKTILATDCHFLFPHQNVSCSLVHTDAIDYDMVL